MDIPEYKPEPLDNKPKTDKEDNIFFQLYEILLEENERLTKLVLQTNN